MNIHQPGSIFSAKSRNQLVTATALLPMTLFLFLRRRWRWPWRGTFNFLASTTGTVVKKSLATASIELRLARDVVHRKAQSLVYVVLRKLLRELKQCENVVRLSAARLYLMLNNVGRPLIRDFLFCFQSEILVTNWAQ